MQIAKAAKTNLKAIVKVDRLIYLFRSREDRRLSDETNWRRISLDYLYTTWIPKSTDRGLHCDM